MNSYPLSRTHPRTKVVALCLWAMLVANCSFIVYFGLFSMPPDARLVHELSRFDLVLHCVVFASLSIPAFILFQPMVRVGLGIFLLGFGLELAQWTTASRDASVSDLAANGLGIALAALMLVMLRRADFAILRPVLGRTG